MTFGPSELLSGISIEQNWVRKVVAKPQTIPFLEKFNEQQQTSIHHMTAGADPFRPHAFRQTRQYSEVTKHEVTKHEAKRSSV